MSFYNDLKRYENYTAAVDEAGNVASYGDMEKFSESVGKVIPKRSLVFLYCANKTGSVLSYISCLNNSFVALLLSDSIEESLNEELLKTYKPSYLFVPIEKKEEFKEYSAVYEEYGYCILKALEKH